MRIDLKETHLVCGKWREKSVVNGKMTKWLMFGWMFEMRDGTVAFPWE